MPGSAAIPQLGPRGEGWFALQLALGAAIVGLGFVGVYWPGSVEAFFTVLGLVIAIAGAGLLAYGGASLGTSFTPLPRPHAKARLRESGAFKLARHPIYGGTLLVALGWSLADAPLALIATVLLAALFHLKAEREELWLAERYPEYAAYRGRTPHRFVPWVY